MTRSRLPFAALLLLALVQTPQFAVTATAQQPAAAVDPSYLNLLRWRPVGPARGGRSIAPELAGEVWREEPDQLTERERAVLRLAGEGLDSAEIGERLHLSAGTVRNYLSEAIGKLGASNRIEAYRLAQQKGWL